MAPTYALAEKAASMILAAHNPQPNSGGSNSNTGSGSGSGGGGKTNAAATFRHGMAFEFVATSVTLVAVALLL